MSLFVEWLTRRDGALSRHDDNRGFGWRRAGACVAIHISITALAVGASAQDVPLGPHVRVNGLPADVALSGGQTNAERAWIVPVRGRGPLKIEVPPGLAGNLDFNVALVGDNGVTLAERAVALRVKAVAAAAPSSEADPASPGSTSGLEPSAATTPTIGFGGRPIDVSLGPHFRIQGLPANVTLSGGHTNAERAWRMPMSGGKQAWMVPLWAIDDLTIEIAPDFAGNLDLLIALADNAGGVVAERSIAVRVKPGVVAARSGRERDAGQRKDVAVAAPSLPASGAAPAAPGRVEPDPGQRKDVAVATPSLPASGATPAAPSRVEPDPGQRQDAAVATPSLPPTGAAPAMPSRVELDPGQRKDVAVATPALPPSAAAPAAPSRPEPDAGQRKDVAVAAPALPPAPAAPAASERKCAEAECRAPAGELEQAGRLVSQGDRYLAQGNIAIARQYFARAADLGLAIAALKLAETYDPNELARPNVYGVKPNLAEARRWYQRAFELDVPEAQARVQRLGTR